MSASSVFNGHLKLVTRLQYPKGSVSSVGLLCAWGRSPNWQVKVISETREATGAKQLVSFVAIMQLSQLDNYLGWGETETRLKVGKGGTSLPESGSSKLGTSDIGLTLTTGAPWLLSVSLRAPSAAGRIG